MKQWFSGLLRKVSLKSKLRLFTVVILLPVGILVGILLGLFTKFNHQYGQIVNNVSTASEFNLDFKKTLDYKMYQYIVGDYKNYDKYAPMDDVNQAREIAWKLEKSTVRPDSLTQLNYIKHYLDNLEKYIKETKPGMRYDDAMANLDTNIRIVTELITESMHNYIYSETLELASLQRRTSEEVQRSVIVFTISTSALFVLLWILSMLFSNSITKPIKAMCKNIKMVGEGDFTIRHVDSGNDEIRTLSSAFNSMVGRIDELMTDVRTNQEHLRSTELRLLQSQINPHFLYNTFDTIIWLAEDKQTEQVVAITSSLSNFFKTTLSKGKDLISLWEEELHVRSYLEIQQVRYRDILSYEISIPSDLKDVCLPKMSLQPLVENALYHGIKHKRGMGKITVSAYTEEGSVFLLVTDNGIGMDEVQLEKINQSLRKPHESETFGCANVHERIRLNYGDPYGLTFESSPGSGTKAIIRLPSSIQAAQ